MSVSAKLIFSPRRLHTSLPRMGEHVEPISNENLLVATRMWRWCVRELWAHFGMGRLPSE